MRDRAPSRVIIENVRPAIDGGRFPIKRTVGEEVVVTADIFAEGHDILAAVILHRAAGAPQWSEVAMTPLGNDRWTGRFLVEPAGLARIHRAGVGRSPSPRGTAS